jgi:D-alanyl-lipoteichoic acid acyltransferase DltB (MBOAT superfamily)
MLFNSATFLQFFAAFLLLYYLCRRSLAWRNRLIVGASYWFYGWWDYRFLALLLVSSLVDFGAGRALEHATAPGRRRLLLGLSIATNLSLLGFFKYYNFFVDSLRAALEGIGWSADWRTLDVVLPIGISFYTFQSMSYTFDVYRGELKPTRRLVDFLAYVAFFPQLVAGPIERARHLLPQFESTLRIPRSMLEEGLWLVLWGLFKKVVLADNLAPLVDLVYGDPAVRGPIVALATLAFGFQIYCDFSGYSDIARGLARWLGFDLRVNFYLPYAATSLREFWRRWHISLSTWLRDYLYIPLGGSRRGRPRTYLNLLLTMLLGGLWHGAAWHFVLWGAWHGAGLAVQRWWSERRGACCRAHPLLGWVGTLAFVFYGWLWFRAESVPQAVNFTFGLAVPSLPVWWMSYAVNLVVFTTPLVLMQLWQGRTGNVLAPLTLPGWRRAALQSLLLLAIVLYWEKEAKQFIYFQF